MLFRWLLCCCRKMILYNRTRLFLCRSLLHRRDGNRVIRRLCFACPHPLKIPIRASASPAMYRFSCGTPPLLLWFQHLHFIAENYSVRFRIHAFLYGFAVFRFKNASIDTGMIVPSVRNTRTSNGISVSTAKSFRFLPCSNSCRQSLHRQTVSLRRIHNLCISAKLWRIHSNLIVRIRRIAVTLEFDRALAAASVAEQPQTWHPHLFLPCAAIPYITANNTPSASLLWPEKLYSIRSATLVCGRFLHRCKG